jgi:hypothetical protein
MHGKKKGERYHELYEIRDGYIYLLDIYIYHLLGRPLPLWIISHFLLVGYYCIPSFVSDERERAPVVCESVGL